MLHLVMAGLDPATHQRPRLRAQVTLWLADARPMDGRLKGGHDGEIDNSYAQSTA